MRDREEVKEIAIDDYLKGAHCAEVVLKYVGREFGEDFPEDLARMATPFGGGIAERGDLCGALAAGLLIIGFMTGRRKTGDTQQVCWYLARQYYDRFTEKFGSSDCADIHSRVYDRDTHVKCTVTVEGAIDIIWDIITQARQKGEIQGE
ncbi:MAG: C-GCAxxG-C-C family protein [Dehalococcoidales bacterium]|nr:C-GCAxxG-C-C family protein [Dehalococcoidales bacterium]